jgi:hypothetical protein
LRGNSSESPLLMSGQADVENAETDGTTSFIYHLSLLTSDTNQSTNT